MAKIKDNTIISILLLNVRMKAKEKIYSTKDINKYISKSFDEGLEVLLNDYDANGFNQETITRYHTVVWNIKVQFLNHLFIDIILKENEINALNNRILFHLDSLNDLNKGIKDDCLSMILISLTKNIIEAEIFENYELASNIYNFLKLHPIFNTDEHIERFRKIYEMLNGPSSSNRN